MTEGGLNFPLAGVKTGLYIQESPLMFIIDMYLSRKTYSRVVNRMVPMEINNNFARTMKRKILQWVPSRAALGSLSQPRLGPA